VAVTRFGVDCALEVRFGACSCVDLSWVGGGAGKLRLELSHGGRTVFWERVERRGRDCRAEDVEYVHLWDGEWAYGKRCWGMRIEIAARVRTTFVLVVSGCLIAFFVWNLRIVD
jgi:hypothetical protein